MPILQNGRGEDAVSFVDFFFGIFKFILFEFICILTLQSLEAAGIEY